MCCLVALAGLVSPRLVLVLWWLVDSARWSGLFDNLIVPVLGFLFLPWTTLVYVFFAPTGFGGLAPIVVVIAVLVDAGTYGGGVFGNRRREQRA
ncbi:MAG: hypothetical protein ACRDGI_00750 [Candidatus Limnocylindrales bacterium]